MPPLKPPRPLHVWMVIAVVFIAVVVGVGVFVGIAAWTGGGTDASSTAQVDIVRTSLSVAAAVVAISGLLLAFRRQQHHESASAATDHDATERRITELYVKAVEQLGSDKAPVRMGGLYALERLAQGNPTQRQTIVEVLCAYLRMPFGAEAADEPKATRSGEEWQVRVAAQKIICRHLRPRIKSQPDPAYWGPLDIDLSGAHLDGFRLHNAEVGTVFMSSAVFVGRTDFRRTRFTGPAHFRGARFTESVSFVNTVFANLVSFEMAHFADVTDFDECHLNGDTNFEGVELKWPKLFEVSIHPLGLQGTRHSWPPGWQIIADPRDPTRRLLVAVPPDED